ncbi:MAG TPA: sulfatase-like hydrolase/transferase [Candidatus Bathyarchaeia archaeon]|nr:sulfatase-like hydrolase/transferase [Candidatus Bathyarchaeia archaeon]
MRRGTLAALAMGAVLLSTPLSAGAADANVLLITIDTLRADRLSCYDKGRGPTPVLDGLAARGVLFERAFAHNPTTLPSHANILSGLTPLAHGVSENSKSVFPAGLPTMASDLKAAGFATGAFIGAFPLDSRFGLDRGFDVYDDAFGAEAGLAGEFKERRAAEVVAAASAWIARQSGPWFCWIHLWDPHAPYAPPEPFLGRFRQDPYAGEVAYVDAEIGVLLGELAALHLTDRTLVVLTADHGEALGEHGELTHSFFAYNSTLHVPLIIAGPGVAARRVPANVAHIDVWPTVRDLVGLGPRPGLQGRSLAGLMKTGKAEDRPIYFESMEPFFDKGCAPVRGFVRGRTKFIDTPIPEVYDLAADFGETKNLAGKAGLGRLRQDLAALEKALSSPTARQSGRVADAPTLERLRSLGYAASPVPQPKASYGPPDDVKSVLPFEQRLERAILLGDSGRAAESIRELETLTADKKDFTPAYVYLARALMAQGRAEDAVRALDAGARENPANYALLAALGSLLVEVRQDDRAAEALTRAIAIIDFDPDAWNNLGGIRMRKGDLDKALECFERAVALDAGFAPAHVNIGAARMASYFGRGRNPDDLAQALDHFRRAVEIDPVSNPALRGLASALTRSGREDEALPVWEKAVAADPKDDFSTYNLGVAYFNQGDKAKALAAFEAYLELRKDSLRPEERERVQALIARCRGGQDRKVARQTPIGGGR